jgi:hypothetical protein
LAALRIAEAARARAQAAAPPGTRYWLSTATVDLASPNTAWGAHLNVSVATDLWEDLFDGSSKPARLTFVSSALAAAIPFFGCGYLLPDDEGPVFCLSSRAHHLTKVATLATTTPYERGILNSRREPHAVDGERLHLIGFDHALAGAALLATFVQCLLLCAENGDLGPVLYAPLDALWCWSIGLDLASGRVAAAMPLAHERRAVTLAGYVEELARFFLARCDEGLIDEELAPEARSNLEKIVELARHLHEGSIAHCARHLDWAAKLVAILELCERESLGLGEPAVRLLDHDFASTDPGRGAFWHLWQAGLIDPLVSAADVEAQLHDGPADGRGWTRGRLVRRFHERITRVDWSVVEIARGASRWEPRLAVALPCPELFGREGMERLLERARDVDELEEALARSPHGAAARTDPVQDVRQRIVRVPEKN